MPEQSCTVRICFVLPALVLLGAAAAFTQTAGPRVPEPLRPWVPWVLEEHPDLDCPRVADERLCAWPGRLELVLDDQGGRFTLDVTADRDLDLPLPGDAARWPRAVTDGGGDALMRRSGERPAVFLSRGRHQLAGRFAWSRLPESLSLPPEIALVDLTVRGRKVPTPRREADGQLWLAGAQAEAAEEDRLDLEVQRRIDDGVPVLLTVRLELRVAGGSREADLGTPLPPGFEAIWLRGGLPLRLDDGRLVVQLRPGEWEILLHARSTGPVTELELSEDRQPPWPEVETWVFAADLAARSVQVKGAPAVDPQRTSLPDDWRNLPAFRVAGGQGLTFEELRRGVASPPPDAVTVVRRLWLSQDGERLTVQDELGGSLYRGGRLEALDPAELGRVALGDGSGTKTDQVITVAEGSERAGVEVRGGDLSLTADLIYPRGGRLPAVGWSRDAHSLTASLELPPGWTLLAAPGVDRATDSWVDKWSLLDIFFLLILTLATWRLEGWRWGLLAFFLLGTGWHEPHFGALWLWWLVLVPLRLLAKVLKPGRGSRFVGGLRWLVLLAFGIQAFVFCASQLRTGFFPQLERYAAGPYDTYGGRLRALGYVDGGSADEVEQIQAPAAPVPSPRQEKSYSIDVLSRKAARTDPEAVVQTGPGVPKWSWTAGNLRWSGPVAADHHLRLWLISPALELVLSLLRVAAALAIAWLIFGGGPWRKAPPSAAEEEPEPPPAASAALAAGLALLFLVPAAARAQSPEPPAPTQSLLAELERRLTEPPPCHPDCVEVPRLVLAAAGDELRIRADVHAAAASAWQLPGPSSSWTPEQVSVDGNAARALRRSGDGFLWLRLPAGTHRVELLGRALESLALQFPLRPRTMEWRGDGWDLEGYRPDAAPPASVRLFRSRPATASGEVLGEGGETELAPRLELQRRLDVGIPWMVHNELRRHGPTGTAVRVKVPLLAGESVTTPGITVADGKAEIGLERGETVRAWRSTLAETGELTLAAAAAAPWLELWELDCSPIWSCQVEEGSLPPMRHMDGGVWRPLWRPWPGESLTLRFTRPAAAAGETATVDGAELELSPGRRLLEGKLTLSLRSSRGGEHRLRLPAEASLQSFTVDDLDQPVQVTDGELAFTVTPGAHQVLASWRQPHRLGIVERGPRVELDSGAVNVQVTVNVPENRWLLWAGGPAWGPVVTMWEYLLVLVLAAWVLGRFAATPLKAFDWFLLGAGMTQVPLVTPVIVVLWLVVLAHRDRLKSHRWWSYNFWQLVLLGLGLAALISLYAAIHAGLLVQPDMQVRGAGSYGSTLHWYADRVDDELPRPWLLWLPLYVWRVLMLLWALWLASRLLRWLPWCWRRFAIGPLLVTPKSFQRRQEEG
jgi:hypothetical protein